MAGAYGIRIREINGGAPPWRTYAMADARLVAMDDDDAVLVHTGTAFPDGAMASAYHRADGAWKLAQYTQTRICG